MDANELIRLSEFLEREASLRQTLADAAESFRKLGTDSHYRDELNRELNRLKIDTQTERETADRIRHQIQEEREAFDRGVVILREENQQMMAQARVDADNIKSAATEQAGNIIRDARNSAALVETQSRAVLAELNVEIGAARSELETLRQETEVSRQTRDEVQGRLDTLRAEMSNFLKDK